MPDTKQQPSLQRLVLVLCIAWVLLNLPLLLGKSVMPWDAIDEFYPTVYFNVHSLRHGVAPWWNPHIYAGYPQIADPQGMLFSPLLMAWMLLRDAPSPVWFSWGVLLHLLMGSIAMLAFLRRNHLNDAGTLLGALVYMAGGVAASRLEHTPIAVAYGYAPVVLLFLRCFLDAPTLLRGALLGLAAGAMATQLVQVSYLFAWVLAAYGAAETAIRWKTYTKPERWRWAGGTVLALVCALALALPQLLFSWAFMGMSNRVRMALSDAAAGSLDARAFLSLFLPNALHALRGAYDGPASLVEAYLYIGAIPLLALLALPRAWQDRKNRPLLVFSLLVACFACLYMLGIHTPFYRWLYTWLPGMQHFRRPSDGAYLLNFALAMTTGIAVSRLDLKSHKETRLLLAITICWLAGASLSMQVDGMRWQACTLLASGFAALALWRLQKPGTEWRTALWLLAVLVVDYRCFNLNGTFNRQPDSTRWFLATSTSRVLAQDLRKENAVLPARLETQNTRATWDNMVMVNGLYSTQGYNPLRYALYDTWYGARSSSLDSRASTSFNRTPDSALAKLLGVRYVVLGHLSSTADIPPPAGFARIDATDDESLWRTEQVYPRLLTPTHALLVAPGERPDPAQFAQTNFRTTLWLTPRDQDDAKAASSLASFCTGSAQATAAAATPTQQDIRVTTQKPAWLVISELDFPGWEAELDGTPIAIHRANGMFRAVCIPPGEHELHFAFHPWAMVAQAWRANHLPAL